jgi:hypothetical protein
MANPHPEDREQLTRLAEEQGGATARCDAVQVRGRRSEHNGCRSFLTHLLAWVVCSEVPEPLKCCCRQRAIPIRFACMQPSA